MTLTVVVGSSGSGGSNERHPLSDLLSGPPLLNTPPSILFQINQVKPHS
jgi:hypothetical protein